MIKNIIFDAGSVLVNWNRLYLYTTVFRGDREKARWFIDNVTTSEWNDMTDTGKPLDECLMQLYSDFPDQRKYIAAYWNCYPDMDRGEIPGMYDLLVSLSGTGYNLYCLTNWSAETFPIVKSKHHRIFSLFNGIVVSAEEKLMKPDTAIYTLLLERYGLNARECIFVDDRQANVDGAIQAGIDAILFKDSRKLAEALAVRHVEI